MIKEVKIPSPGESISEVEIANWLVEDGDYVERNDELAEVESDKATLMLVADDDGIVSIKAQAGETVKVDSVACTIDTEGKGSKKTSKEKDTGEEKSAESSTKDARSDEQSPKKEEAASNEEKSEKKEDRKRDKNEFENVKVTPVAAKVMEENNLNIEDVIKGLRRLSKSDVASVIENKGETAGSSETGNFSRESNAQKMSMLRRKLSERLVSVKNDTAMLTTFNEVDMSTVMNTRKKVQNKFTEKHGFKLGFMGFFTKAVSIAAQLYPMVNSRLDGEEIITPEYVDVGIAVQSPKGLMVPVVRNAESKSITQIEKDIKELAQKARDKKISMEELSGGTFSITNGGVFGSLMSTPILNPPQSAILGMHNIVDRPVAVDGQVVIRPMMYIALSYDHRIIDGKDSVGFLKTIKELIENPERMINQGQDPVNILLEI